MKNYYGPSYKEQQDQKFDEYFDTHTPNAETIDAYRTAIINTEDIYLERLRNKITPIINFIEIVKNIYTNDNKNNLESLLLDKQLWNSTQIAVNEILDIKNQ